MAQEENKLAFLDDSLPWRGAFYLLLGVTGILVVCHLLRVPFNFPVNKSIAIHPEEIGSLPAVIFAHFFHVNDKHLEGNLLAFWLLGLWSLKKEGSRAINGMCLGGLFAGLAIWAYGSEGTIHAGFSTVVFALMGVLIISSIRGGPMQIIIMCIAVYVLFIQDVGTLTIFPSKSTEGVSWLGHLGGMVGGMYSQIRNPVIALQILADGGHMTPVEVEQTYRRIVPVVGNDGEKKEDSASDDSDKGEESEDSSQPNLPTSPRVKRPRPRRFE